MAEEPGDDRMHLSDEKPVEEVIADAAEEIRKRDERIKELEGEVDSLERVQQKIYEVADKALKATESKQEKATLKSDLRFMAIVFAVVVVCFGGVLGIGRCVKSHNETMAMVEAAAQKPPLTLAELANYAGQKIHNSWPSHKVLLVGNGEMQLCNLVRVDKDVYDILGQYLPNDCSSFCHGNSSSLCNVILELDKVADIIQEIQLKRQTKQQKIKILQELKGELKTDRVEY